MLGLRLPPDLSPSVQRLVVWTALGCVLVRAAGSWRLERPATMRGTRGPAPKTIQDRTAQEAIRYGARVSAPADLFGRAA